MAKVAIVMGSESDLPVLLPAFRALDDLGIAWQARVLSAHRTPEAAAEFSKTAHENGIAVIIAAAGKAAHLAGAMAAHTVIPVIGVPVKASALEGMDALLSTVQMPPGIPVATVAIDGAKNAALLAAQILALGDDTLRGKLVALRDKAARAVDEVAFTAKVKKQLSP
ncbi:MAG: 5-(carboxyamino)imidazole ribonucleotide mutase [Oscillospiraceae bacterium]|jgi:5-(carboxyamino)imidazole ribonucleotide mutase|nr:5-(carboxyamino)imidazole ribonucleotide mutase [Oscillospiraceae bacterium]